MRKTVLVFGLASGALSAAMMVAMVPMMHSGGFKHGLLIGYTAILLAALLVFFGVRSYREKVGAGRLSFGRGLAVGVSIAAISAICYSATWLVLTVAMPDLTDKVATWMVDERKASGASDAEVLEAARQADQYKELARNPVLLFLMTLVEPFPVGLVVAAISAAVLRRKGTLASPA
jgi:hypothetical protein